MGFGLFFGEWIISDQLKYATVYDTPLLGKLNAHTTKVNITQSGCVKHHGSIQQRVRGERLHTIDENGVRKCPDIALDAHRQIHERMLIQKLDEFVLKRHILQEKYDTLLANLPVIRPHQDLESYSALHLYPIQINLENISKGRKQIFMELREKGIGVNVHYIPIHTQPYYKKLGFKEGDFPNSENYYSRAISLPLFHAMTLNQQDEVFNALKSVLR